MDAEGLYECDVAAGSSTTGASNGCGRTYMPESPSIAAEAGEFTQLLSRFREGEQGAQEMLARMILADLRRIAHRHLAGSRWMNTLNTTSVVNESYLRLVSPAARHVATRAHFLNLASRIMRQIICDYARKRVRESARFERDVLPEDVREDAEQASLQARQLAALDEALNDLARINARHARVIECRFFAGLSEEETSAALDVSLRTVQRDWNEARNWLAQHMRDV